MALSVVDMAVFGDSHKMHQSPKEIKLIRPPCEKLEQKSPEDVYSFLFFGNSFENTQEKKGKRG